MAALGVLFAICVGLVLWDNSRRRKGQSRSFRESAPAELHSIMRSPGDAAGVVCGHVSVGIRFTPKSTLVRTEELRFLHVLEQALGPEYRVFAMVRVADVVNVLSSDRSRWQSMFNQISCKHFDFVVCRPSDLAVLFAVELNGSSHDRYDRRQRDKFLAEVCAAAGLPLFWFPVQTRYSVEMVRATLLQLPLAS